MKLSSLIEPSRLKYRKDIQQARLEMRDRFLSGRKAEIQYARRLRSVANQVGDLITGMAPNGIIKDLPRLRAMLIRYTEILQPWAESVAGRMIADVNRRDAMAWHKHGESIGQALRKEIENAPTGAVMQKALAEQAARITSIPTEAAERLFKLTTEGITKGTRASEIAAEVMRSGEVAKSTANMLARTAVSSTATALTRARAEYINSPGYFWETSRDGDVRPSHKAMQGKFVRWDEPPTLDGYTAHCGEFANCRCYPNVQVPDRI